MSVNPKNQSDCIHKIVISGPVGAGKTQAINVLSDTEMVTTESNSSTPDIDGKKTITVAMDYGLITLDSGAQVHLYGTPGHKRFDFMWDILSENASGLILLINASAADPIADLQSYVDSFKPLINNAPLVIGVTHTENAPSDLQQRLSDYLTSINVTANVMLVDARNREEMHDIVSALIETIAQ